MPDEEMHTRVLTAASLPCPPADPVYPSMQHADAQPPARIGPSNLVIILGREPGRAVRRRNSSGDSLTLPAWTPRGRGLESSRGPATGTRSVRGLEAVVTGFHRLPAQAVVKLPRCAARLFHPGGPAGPPGLPLALHLRRRGAFRQHEGLLPGQRIRPHRGPRGICRPVQFVGTWGASDEDMFNQLTAC